MSIGNRIREKRKEHKLTLEQLATKIKSSKSYVWEIENDKKSVSAEILLGIATELKTTTDYLLGGDIYKVSKTKNQEEGIRDIAFFRQYEKMNPTAKTALQKMLNALDDED